MSDKIKRFEMVFSKNDMAKILVEEGTLRVDVHGMTCNQAKHFLKNVIALINGTMTFYVVHGYNNGVAIKKMLKSETISSRVTKVESVSWNPGMTRLVIA